MKNKYLFTSFLVALMACFTFVSCEDDDDEKEVKTENNFESLDAPYLICASRNPGGIGFDFEYMDEKGGADNYETPSVSDFSSDIIVKTVKGEKPDQTLGGVPFIQLADQTTEAINYSSIDNTCKGYEAFQNLSFENVKSYSLQKDQTSFAPESLPVGSAGAPVISDLQNECKKLVIGTKWKTAANNDVPNDEPVWLIKTREGKMVKLIVTQFPAAPAPTATGYITIEWDFL